MIDSRDAALLASCPALAVPKFSPLPDMPRGQRLLVAANGVFLQAKTTWLDCMIHLADMTLMPPYGAVTPYVRCAFGEIPSGLLRDFVAWARAAMPDEIAAALVYSASSGALRMARCEPVSQSSHGIRYRMPRLAADECVAVDLHSHGTAAAFFSATDDADDLGLNIAGVFGHLDRPVPSARFRLVVGRVKMGLALPKGWPPEGE